MKIFLFSAEEEASKLRFYVDEPAFTDLHWVIHLLQLHLSFLFHLVTSDEFEVHHHATCLILESKN